MVYKPPAPARGAPQEQALADGETPTRRPRGARRAAHQATSTLPTRPLRVALVTGSYNYIRDGVALTLNRLVAYLLRHGVEVEVFAPVGPKPALEHAGTLVPVPSIAVPLRPEYRLARGLPAAIRERLITFSPDIVHIATPDFLGHGALKLAQARGWPVLASYHTRYDTYLSYYHLTALKPLADGIARRFYGACAEVLAPSASMADALVADGVEAKIRLWPRGVDTARFDPARRSMAWRDRLGLKPDEIAVAFVSRLVREKRIEDYAQAVERASRAGLPVRALVVGDGPEREALSRRLPGAIFTGFLTGDDLAVAYASADIFLFPSDTETFGNVTLEAMASGLPALVADATGSRSLVVDGETGFVAPVGDVETYVAALTRLVGDKALRQRMGEAGRARSLTFSWDAAMAIVLDAYQRLSGRAPAAASEGRA
ncbi:MAG: glycosyltransferase family 1 protein [Alphaproteobacteria bacterium]|nr:glycosyltransferase family 1 protein [Alphaproteobacteria bacterium]